MTRKTLVFIVTLGLAGALFAADLHRNRSHDAAAQAVVAEDAQVVVSAPHETAGMVTLVAW